MITIQQALQHGREQLTNKVDNPQNESLLLLEYITNKRKEFLISHSEQLLDSNNYQCYQDCLTRRSQGEPLAYITQQKEFWSLSLDISPDVLIPRPETELLIETILQTAITFDNIQTINILDLGTGSGCIALALASELPNAKILASDISQACINLAKKNATKFSLNNVNFIVSNWYQSIPQQKFHIIVSNPPYIAADDKHIDYDVAQFEPSQALFSENQGYADIDKIIHHAPEFLISNGTLVLEHGFQQAAVVRKQLTNHHFIDIQTHKDVQQHERVTRAVYS